MRKRATNPKSLTGGRRTHSVVVADPLHLVRTGLRLLIDREPDMEVVAEASTVEEADRAVHGLRRNRLVVLVGLGLAGERDAFWLIRALRERHPSLSIVATAARAEPLRVSRALFVGADGFVDKDVEPELFLEALRRVARGEMVLIGPSASLIGPIAQGIDLQRDVEGLLTERERQVLRVAAEGLTAKEIAARLGVRERTITTHLGRIYGKLGVRGRVAAIRAAEVSGLVAVGAEE